MKAQTKSKKLTAKAMVLAVLQDCPGARNSDAVLYEKVYERYYGRQVLSGTVLAFLRLLRDDEIVDPDNLRRTRARIQNDEAMFRPTDPETMRRRGRNY